MTNKYNLGDNVYTVDLQHTNAKKAVNEGTVIGVSLSSTGYIIYRVRVKDTDLTKEQAYVFDTKQDAIDAFGSFKVIKQEADLRIKSLNNEVNMLRESIIGVPEYPQYAAK